MSLQLYKIDKWLVDHPQKPQLKGFKRFLTEFWFFGLKSARACLFAGLFFISMMLYHAQVYLAFQNTMLCSSSPFPFKHGWYGPNSKHGMNSKPSAYFIWSALPWKRLRSRAVFNLGPILIFLTPKYLVCPCFQVSCTPPVGSYIIQAWRLLDMRIRHHPPYGLAALASLMIYVNFFTHHYIGDYRWYIGAFALGLYSRTRVIFRPYERDRWMPLLLGFVLTGFFIWLAENIGTFLGVWRYPNQIGAWATVHIGKWSSWTMLVVMTFTIIVNLKHVKETIHVPEP